MISSKLRVEPLIVGPLFSNCYIVWDDSVNEGVVIDPGDDADIILKRVKELDISVSYILATHGHFDHVGAVMPLKRELKAEFLAHKGDFFFIENGESSARRWGIDIEQPPKPDRFIEDGDKVKIGKLKLKVIHTPGHSPGSICVYWPEKKVLFTGDVVFNQGVGRTDVPGGKGEELKESIRKISRLDVNHLLPGHGDVISGRELVKANFAEIERVWFAYL